MPRYEDFSSTAVAERFWSPNYIQHRAHIPPGRDGLLGLVKDLPSTLKYEMQSIVADADKVIQAMDVDERPRTLS